MKSCKEIAKLMVPGTKLTFFEKMETKLHLFVCDLCKRYEKQLELLSFNNLKLINKKQLLDTEDIESLEQEIIEKVKKIG